MPSLELRATIGKQLACDPSAAEYSSHHDMTADILGSDVIVVTLYWVAIGPELRVSFDH